MNRYRLSKAGVSTSEGIARLGGNMEKYEALLTQFLTDRHFAEMCAAIGQGDAAAAFQAAHALKGIVGNLSMNRLYTDLYPLVEALRGGSLDTAAALLPQVQKDYAEIAAALEHSI